MDFLLIISIQLCVNKNKLIKKIKNKDILYSYYYFITAKFLNFFFTTNKSPRQKFFS